MIPRRGAQESRRCDGLDHIVLGHLEREGAVGVELSYGLKPGTQQRPESRPSKSVKAAGYATRPWRPFSAVDVFLRQLPISLPMGLLR